MTKNVKIAMFAILFLAMLVTTFWASMQQNLFTEFSWSGSPMWFQATIVDFYINQFILWLWVCTLEKSHIVKGGWLVLFLCFGSMGTCAYAISRLVQNKPLIPFKPN